MLHLVLGQCFDVAALLGQLFRECLKSETFLATLAVYISKLKSACAPNLAQLGNRLHQSTWRIGSLCRLTLAPEGANFAWI